LKPPFKRGTGAKDLKANIISMIFCYGGQQFIFGFGLLSFDFLVFVDKFLFLSKYSFFQRLSSSLLSWHVLPSSFTFLYQFFGFSDLGPEKGFVMEHQGNCLLADAISREVFSSFFSMGEISWETVLFPPDTLYCKMLRHNSASSKASKTN